MFRGQRLQSGALLLVLASTAFAQDSAKDEAEIWKREKAYWEYVKANDLEKYRALWHEDFVGWPFISPSPVHKDRITDWITSNTAKAIKLQSYSLEQLAIQVTGNVAVNHYRIKMDWSAGDKTPARSDTLRITHTWIRNGDNWQIIGGMSAPVNDKGQ